MRACRAASQCLLSQAVCAPPYARDSFCFPTPAGRFITYYTKSTSSRAEMQRGAVAPTASVNTSEAKVVKATRKYPTAEALGRLAISLRVLSIIRGRMGRQSSRLPKGLNKPEMPQVAMPERVC